MRRRAWVWLSLVAVGCQGPRADLAALETDLPGLLAQAEGPCARGQKKDKAPNPLDVPPGGDDRQAVRIRAVVNNEAILDEEVVAAAYQALATERDPAKRAKVMEEKLTELIDREVVLQDAIAKLSKGGGPKYLKQLEDAAAKEFEKQWLRPLMRGNRYTSEEEFKRYLREHGMPLDVIKRHWVRNFMAMEYLRHRIEPHLQKVGHLQVVEYYERHPEEFQVGDEVRWQDLTVAAAKHPTRAAAREFAEVLAARVRKGEDFAQLAQQFDDGDSALRENAAGIGTKRGEVKPPEAEPALFGLKDGDVAVVEVENGFHVVRVLKRQYAGKLPFDEKVQKQVKDTLRNQVFQREMKRIVNDLKRRAVIEVAGERR